MAATKTANSRSTSSNGNAKADDTAEAATERIRDLNERIIESSKKAGRTYLDIYERLGSIEAPTLVVHGAADRMVAPANARLLADAIPSAELLSLPDAGHLYPTNKPAADQAVARFLSGRSSRGRSAPARR